MLLKKNESTIRLQGKFKANISDYNVSWPPHFSYDRLYNYYFITIKYNHSYKKWLKIKLWELRELPEQLF